MNSVKYLLQALRPTQWIKNLFIFAPILFAQKIFYFPEVAIVTQAVVVFCFLSGAVYLINDILDIDSDRQHPDKKHRPIASDLVSPRAAIITAGILLCISMAWGLRLESGFFLILIIYLAIQFLYNLKLKDTVILDVFCVSAGFFLRVISGGIVIGVQISRWLIICSILLAVFLSLSKRRHEIIALGNEHAETHRKVLSEYQPYLLDQMIGVITGSILLSYMLYCISSETIEKFQTDRLIYTFPFVLYGIFRYLYLIHFKKKGGAPEKVLLTDMPLLISVALWGLACVLIIYGKV